MRGLELRWLYLALDDHFAFEGLLGVFLVQGEWGNSLVIAELGRVRWFEGPIVLDSWRSLGLRGPVGNGDVLTYHVLVLIEEMRLLDHLGERLLLEFAVVMLTLCLCYRSWPVEVIGHVGDRASEVALLAVLTFLNRVGADVWRLRDDLSGVLLAPEVLLDLNEVSLVFISGLIVSLLDLALVLETLLISGRDLSSSVF